MNEPAGHFGFLRDLTWGRLALTLSILVACRLLVIVARQVLRRAAESAPSHRRLLILRIAPLSRLLIWTAGLSAVVAVLVEPNFEDFVAVAATIGLAIAFAVKDYVSCLIAGVVTILENTYQPGDWIELDGAYGEVKTIGTRAVHIVTADDTEIVIPHSRIWSSSLGNASGGQRSLMCTTNFYLRPDHDAAAALQGLTEITSVSRFLEPGTRVIVAVTELPWGTRYKVKAYAADSREQFAMITDLTVRGKERLRAMGMAFAQAPYAETGKD